MASAEIKAITAIGRVLDRQLDALSGPERDRVVKWLTAWVAGQTPTQTPLAPIVGVLSDHGVQQSSG